MDEPALVVEAQLTDLRIVSTAARFWGGLFAGRSHMRIAVTIKNLDGRQIAQKDLFGAPNALGPWNDQPLPTRMGYLLGEYIIAEANRYFSSTDHHKSNSAL